MYKVLDEGFGMKNLLFLYVFLLALPGGAFGEEISGVVRVVGSAINAKVLLTKKTEFKGPAVCRGDVAKRVSRLTGLTVKVKGEWKLKKSGKKKCFTVGDFTVLKASSGRDALVGTLTKESEGYKVKTDDGKVHALSDIPAGLKELAGKKVIIDVKPMNNPVSATASYKVVTYSEFP